jgi:4-hydroxybenzoate polyprenyltransferase
VKSIAVKYRDHIMKFLSVLGGVMIALLVTSGLYSGFGLAYFLLSCAGPAIAMAITLFDVDLTNPKSCAWWFINGTYYVGLPLAGGLFAECALQLRP